MREDFVVLSYSTFNMSCYVHQQVFQYFQTGAEYGSYKQQWKYTKSVLQCSPLPKSILRQQYHILHIVTPSILISHYKQTRLTELFEFTEAVTTPDLEVGVQQSHVVYPSAIPDLGIRIRHCIKFNKIKILECPSREIMCQCGSQQTSCSVTTTVFITTDSHTITIAPSEFPQISRKLYR